MILKWKSFRPLTRDWAVGLVLLAVFFLTNGYIYGWDDQHLEIPLLKALINPGLYPGDYYVESLKANFPSYLYRVLARLITLEQIPTTYLLLFIFCRYVFFLFVYKLWRLLSGDKFSAVICTLMIMLLGRVDEFLYRTFSHQEFALAFIVVGIYLFYKERFLPASLVLGLSANVHVLYSFFPFLYICAYLLFFQKQKKWRRLFTSLAGFFFAAAPLIFLIVQKKLLTPAVGTAPTDWLALYKIACPQNLILYDNSFRDFLGNGPLIFERAQPYLLVGIFFLLNFSFNPDFRRDKKSLTVILVGTGLILASFIFTYIWPVRKIVDLNLIRNIQYMLFFLMGYTALWFIRQARQETRALALVLMLMFFILIRFGGYTVLYAGCGMVVVAVINARNRWSFPSQFHPLLLGVLFAALGAVILGIRREFQIHTYNASAMLSLGAIFVLSLLTGAAHFFSRSPSAKMKLRLSLVIIPFAGLLINYIHYHSVHLKMEKTGSGFWQLQRNWLDMQAYVRNNLPKNALLMVPHDMEMGGFRIFSERPILVSYRDCGIIGFDYAAAVEWKRRLEDVGAFQVLISRPLLPALKNAVQKYRVHYIVFMRYIDPGPNALLEPVYKNETFALYNVKPNPVHSER